ncbi:LOW QUALITY PROTEIN: hypothetical protein NLU13_8692 [Sarocladium strictum]|uniref:Uncharacterized protein n=1 Tax=Sarocladium strictum TaxID=5046 RepID=A0AA39GCH6_SARSR|nr:LOW QUALITY PROTEIN: hypothetical protein NLU13_8692 [Sarocladium strictum]
MFKLLILGFALCLLLESGGYFASFLSAATSLPTLFHAGHVPTPSSLESFCPVHMDMAELSGTPYDPFQFFEMTEDNHSFAAGCHGHRLPLHLLPRPQGQAPRSENYTTTAVVQLSRTSDRQIYWKIFTYAVQALCPAGQTPQDNPKLLAMKDFSEAYRRLTDLEAYVEERRQYFPNDIKAFKKALKDVKKERDSIRKRLAIACAPWV